MNSAEIQYALDRRGTVDIDSGTSITTPIQLAHLRERPIVNCSGGDITYNGPPGRWAFEWNWDSNYVHTPCSPVFKNIDFDRNNVSHGGFLRIHPGDKSPLKLTMKQCDLWSDEGYAIDANGVASCESLFFQDIRTFDGCSLRWIGASKSAIGWCEIDNWRRIGSARVGSNFMLKNLKNVLLDRIIDEGTPELIDGLKNVYVGPISVSFVNCEGFNLLYDLWMEPIGTWDDLAPDCWGVSARADGVDGNHSQHVVELKRVTLNASGLGAGTFLFHVYGGDTSNDADNIRVNIVDRFNLRENTVLFAGKCHVIGLRPFTNQIYSTDDINYFENANTGSFRRYWQVTSFAHPYKVYADRRSYSGSGYQDTYSAEPAQYDA